MALFESRAHGADDDYIKCSSVNSLLSPMRGSPDSLLCPPDGGRIPVRENMTSEKEWGMNIARRVAIALGSLLAIALAGGAHWKA